jgi:hypothetical protein
MHEQETPSFRTSVRTTASPDAGLAAGDRAVLFQVRRRSRWHLGAVLFTGQPRSAVSAGSAVSISQPAKAAWTSACDARPASRLRRLGPKLSSSKVARGLASAETPSSSDGHCPASRPLEAADAGEEAERPEPG